jgi:peptidoglycan/xylan/chitin deacetylase (PgdA/CDA1 family)
MSQLIILMYHAVIPAPLQVADWCFVNATAFRSQLEYLAGHYTVLSLSEAVAQLTSGRLHGPAVTLTFDDGFQNNHDVAFPILQALGMPATIFLTTGLVETDDTLWFCRLNHALAKTNKDALEWGGSRFDLSGPGPRAKAASVMKTRLKTLPHSQLLGELRALVLRLGDDPDCPVEVGSPFRMLSRQAIASMSASGLIEFGAHSQSHAILRLLTLQERYNEIVHSVATVSTLTGRACALFAYPNGQIQDYAAEDINILRSCGVRISVTAMEGVNDSQTPPMELRRYGIGAHDSMEKFRQILDGGLPCRG